jgi:hypothetical protein
MGCVPQLIHFHSMQKTTLSQASRFFSALAAGAMLLLLAGCNLTITNLTPDTVPQNPSQIYTITASFRPSSQVEPATVSPRIIIDGQPHAMSRSTVGVDIWEFDFQLPAGRTSASYYFICDFATKGSAQTSEVYSELQRLNVAGRYVLQPEANRAPVGARVSVLGAGFTTSDLVYFDENPTRTVFESPSSLSFFVPAVVPGRNYKLTVRGAGINLDAGTFRVDAVFLQVFPSALSLRTGETQEVTFTIAQPAPAGGMLIDVTTDIKDSVIMPDVIVPAGGTSVSVPVQGAKPGTGSLFYRSSAGEGSVAITVSGK